MTCDFLCHYMMHRHVLLSFFFFNDTATTEIYTLSLHDALPISQVGRHPAAPVGPEARRHLLRLALSGARSEEHTSELQSLAYLVCRLLLEKKKIKKRSWSTGATTYYHRPASSSAFHK